MRTTEQNFSAWDVSDVGCMPNTPFTGDPSTYDVSSVENLRDRYLGTPFTGYVLSDKNKGATLKSSMVQ